MERRPLWLRPPGGMKIEPAAPPEEAPRPPVEAAETAPVPVAPPPEPSPQELARAEAERIVTEARAGAEAIARQAREQGYAEGLKEGMEQGRTTGREEGLAELRGALDRWLTMGDALTEAWRRRFEGIEAEVKDVAAAVAERLVEGHLAVEPETVVAVVRESLRHAAEADLVTVKVSPKDAALVRAAKDDLGGLLRGTGRFEIVEDAAVEPGACVIETRTQIIDATRKARMDELRGELEAGSPQA